MWMSGELLEGTFVGSFFRIDLSSWDNLILCILTIHSQAKITIPFPNPSQSSFDPLLLGSFRIMSSKSSTTSDIIGLNSGSDCKLWLMLGYQLHFKWKAKSIFLINAIMSQIKLVWNSKLILFELLTHSVLTWVYMLRT